MDDFELNLEFLRSHKMTDQDCDVLVFLEELRQSGTTNMFNALPYMEKEFPDISKKHLLKLLQFYMQHYSDIYIFEKEEK